MRHCAIGISQTPEHYRSPIIEVLQHAEETICIVDIEHEPDVRGITVAVPVPARARRIAAEIIEYGRRRDPWMGFKVENVHEMSQGFRAQYGIRVDSGCLVMNILKNSPAYESGVRSGDVITGINAHTVHTSTDIDFVVWGLFVGDTVALDIDRGGKKEKVSFPVKELQN